MNRNERYPPPFQFALRTLMLATTATAITLGIASWGGWLKELPLLALAMVLPVVYYAAFETVLLWNDRHGTKQRLPVFEPIVITIGAITMPAVLILMLRLLSHVW